MTGVAPLLFAVIDTSATYWAYGFPAAIAAVFGADFIFASGSLFVAKVARPNEQSVAGGLFNTLAQVCKIQFFSFWLMVAEEWFMVFRLERRWGSLFHPSYLIGR